ncbi:MAG: hypothetical protein IPK71_18580 [Myxococcales bacterium]|nr:hypothetical protein [Myxococcales bacterium]MBL9112694.1 hypothetical protein [Myxococcales bacterium]
MKALSFFRSTLAFASISALFVSSTALADEAVVVVGGPYAEPPPRAVQPIEPRTSYEPRYDRDDLYERRRSPVRVALGPSFLTTGQGLGVGLGVGLELGSGMVGGRLGAAWLRGEGTKNGVLTPTGDSVGHYVGELTFDVVKRGPFHPVFGVGAGILHVSRPDVNGVVAVGTARASLEYFTPIEEADLRLGLDATVGLAGPGAEALKDVKAYGLFGLHAALGF